MSTDDQVHPRAASRRGRRDVNKGRPLWYLPLFETTNNSDRVAPPVDPTCRRNARSGGLLRPCRAQPQRGSLRSPDGVVSLPRNVARQRNRAVARSSASTRTSPTHEPPFGRRCCGFGRGVGPVDEHLRPGGARQCERAQSAPVTALRRPGPLFGPVPARGTWEQQGVPTRSGNA